ncbi:phosphatidylinositol-glycan biosynthesis class W protein isoform X2 [Protopterus annectens]|nr:phosphatidylinositol-glycan biosynthesis class W protein isoform X2 [Protopterus annectens]
MSQKLFKEEFVSHLNGTSLGEISLGLSLPPLCLMFRGLVLISLCMENQLLGCSWFVHLLFDFTVLVAPLVFSCTVFSGFLILFPVGLIALNTTLLLQLYNTRRPVVPVRSKHIIDEFLNCKLEAEHIPSVTVFRVSINMLTAVSILAVDFVSFPRRYAKTESYGTGVMDFGVGAFVFANALVCPEVRRKNTQCSQSKEVNVVKQLISVWPFILLGVGRLITVKAADYHEHTSEYGVHWNFFFTLAVVRVASSLLLTHFSVNRSGMLSVIIAVFYQIVLQSTELKMFILHGNTDDVSRTGFLNANREGIFSVIGYVAIYMAGIQVGLFVLTKRITVKDWIPAICWLMFGSFALFTLLWVVQIYIEPVSRRIANLPFCIWIVAQSLYFLSFILLLDLVLLFAKLLSGGSVVPSSWNISHSFNLTQRRISNQKFKPFIQERNASNCCLFEAINRNQLLFFLQSNVMTGIVNMLTDTINTSTAFSIFILLLYMFCNSFIMYVLHMRKITIKYW